MEHYFELPIACDGAQHRFRARLITFGYSYKFYVIINGKEWTFEKDEARAMQLTSSVVEGNANISQELLSRIMEELDRRVVSKK